MPNDLEDFLRRAAQRRQQKAAQEKQQAPQQRREPPQYSDSRTERVARSVEPEEPVLVADIVEDPSHSYAARLQQVEDAKRAAAQVQREAKRTANQSAKKAAKQLRRTAAATGNPATDLITLLKKPGGMQQAILLREIFDRPEHRW
jgi:hypothetical protein